MKTLLLSTALVAGLGTVALAQATPGPFLSEATAGSVRASDLIGARIYASEAAIDADEYAGVQEGWNDIGEVNDVILSRTGQVEAVLVDIGGFLGMGEHQVAVSMGALKFTYDSATADNPDDWFLVLNANRATLEGSPAWPTGAAMTGAMTGAATDMAADAAQTTAPADAMAVPSLREGFTAVASADITSEQLTGAAVYGPDDTSLGSISDLVIGADGKVTEVIVDVGGFLGIGARPVALTLSDLEILRDADGDEIRVFVPMTREQIEALPERQV